MSCVLVTDHVFADLETERALIEPLGLDVVLAPATDEHTLAGLAEHAKAMLVCYAPVPREVIEAAGECRVIARYGIGVDNVDVHAATEAGILVTNVPDYCLDEVADHTLALLLAVVRGIVGAAEVVRRGEWAVPQEPLPRLRGRRLALIGLGGIGRRVAERALAFGLEVVGFDPLLEGTFPEGVRRVDMLDEAVADADIVSLHAPMTPATGHLIDERLIRKMRRSPILLNTSRGGLVDLNALTEALDEGRLSAVALDVTEPEPLPVEHPLRRHPRALITPHIGFYSVEAQQELQRRAAEEVVRALSGEPPRCPVNPEVLATLRAGR